MSKKKVDPLQLAEEASEAFTSQAEEAGRAMQKQADEAAKAMEADISPFWDNPEEYRKKTRNSVKAGGRLLTGSLTAPEPYKEENTDEANTIKIVFGTSGEYPDGTKWERDATPEEAAKYDEYCS